jgi:type I restriction enzyme, S subunit
VSRWPSVGIADLEDRGVLQLGRGKVISKKDLATSPGTYPVYSSAKENDGKFGEYGHYMFDEELITWSVDGGGSLFHRPKHRFSITNVGGFVRVLDKQAVDCRYLFFVLSWLHSQVQFDWVRKAHPSVIRKVYTAFPLPPLEEQKRIVAVLDEAFAALDRARTLAEANLADARALFEIAARSIFSEDAVRNAGTKLVSELAQKRKGAMRTGPFGSDLRHSEFVDKGVKVLGIDNAVQNRFVDGKPRYITEQKYAELKRYRVFPGDVIITIMGTCGRCAVIPDDIPLSINTKHLCCISLDQAQCLPSFLHRYFLLSPRAREYLEANAKGSVMDGLNLGLIKDLPVQLPGLSDQRRICAKVEALETSAQSLAVSFQSKIQELNALRQSLLQKAFAGELT